MTVRFSNPLPISPRGSVIVNSVGAPAICTTLSTLPTLSTTAIVAGLPRAFASLIACNTIVLTSLSVRFGLLPVEVGACGVMPIEGVLLPPPLQPPGAAHHSASSATPALNTGCAKRLGRRRVVIALPLLSLPPPRTRAEEQPAMTLALHALYRRSRATANATALLHSRCVGNAIQIPNREESGSAWLPLLCQRRARSHRSELVAMETVAADAGRARAQACILAAVAAETILDPGNEDGAARFGVLGVMAIAACRRDVFRVIEPSLRQKAGAQ